MNDIRSKLRCINIVLCTKGRGISLKKNSVKYVFHPWYGDPVGKHKFTGASPSSDQHPHRGGL